MAHIKTAISVQEDLLAQADILARELDISRSRLFALAIEEFVRRYENQKLLEAINSAYDDAPDPEEQMLQRQMQSVHRRQVKGQW